MTDGTCYLPDFYLPQMKEFFEVKGELKSSDIHKIDMFVKEYKRPLIIGYDNLLFSTCSNYSGIYNDENEFIRDTQLDSVLMKCNKCGKYYFAGINGTWECQCCGYYDGDNTSEFVSLGNHGNNLIAKCKWTKDFEAAVLKAKQARFEYGERG